MLLLLSVVAQAEREFIKQRQAEGIAMAKAKGGVFGRRPIEKPENLQNIKILWREGKLSARKAAEQLGASHKTILKWGEDR